MGQSDKTSSKSIFSKKELLLFWSAISLFFHTCKAIKISKRVAMNKRNQSPLWKAVIAIVLATLVASCQPTTPPTQAVGHDEIQDVRVQTAEPIKNISKVEEFPLPNCGGSDKLGQSLGTFASVSKSATVGAKAAVTGGGDVAIPETAKLKLEIQVELAYQQTFQAANSRLDTIEMSAAAGTHVVYTIVWEEQTFNSIVQYSSEGKVYQVPYTYVLNVPKIDKSYSVACDESSETTAVAATQAPPVQVVTVIILPPTPLPSSTDIPYLIPIVESPTLPTATLIPTPTLIPCPPGVGPSSPNYPSGIVAGDYPPESLTQEQRQWLFEIFGKGVIAPVGYGGERCQR